MAAKGMSPLTYHLYNYIQQPLKLGQNAQKDGHKRLNCKKAVNDRYNKLQGEKAGISSVQTLIK